MNRSTSLAAGWVAAAALVSLASSARADMVTIGAIKDNTLYEPIRRTPSPTERRRRARRCSRAR